ncbi:MAG: hypothetical protein ACK4V2_02810 [Pseudomonadota bacterium]
MIIIFVSIFAFLWSADSEEKDNLKTPEKKPTAIFSVLTPGEVVSKLQSEVLKKDRFISVFGEATVESWGFDWEELENPDISFADSSRIFTMSKLHEKLTKAARTRFDEPFSDLYAKFLTLRGRITVVHAVRLEAIADEYFHGIFPRSLVDHDTKDGGVQLGTKAKVTLATGEERIYHIKTHSDGRLSEKSSAPKRINPQELLCYKILEYIGFGCESHFLQRSAEDVYIATLNAGHGGSFDMFVKATGRLGTGDNEAYGQTLWGLLQNVHKDPRQNDWNAVRELIHDDAIAQNFLVQMVSLDMLTRILRLHDLLNNTENFGFFKTGEEKPALKVIDFRITDGENFYVNFEHFGGFLEGNGLYNYVGSHRTMRYVLHDRPRAERVETALHILTQGPLMQLHQHVERAYRDVCEYITNTDVFADHLAELMEKLNTFHDAIHQNIDFFVQRLQSWEPEVA